ncbi:MAG: MATE family efflux transporter [Lachnospiraceae bacterium]|nr:MATE family efflux transporter [Lachnospiraceae bacterium]
MQQNEAQYRKMTEMPVGPLVIRLGIPTTLSMLVTTVYNLADNYFVGKLNNTSASGAIGVVFGLMAILQAFGFMFGHGAGSIIARSLGKRDKESATRFASTGFFCCFATGIVLMALGLCFLTPLMRLLGSSETILPYAKEYTRYILLAAPFLTTSCVLNNILRYEGRANLAMIGLMSGGILNIFLDWLFTLKMGLGVTGAGIATGVSQTVGFLLLLSMFLRKKTETVIDLKYVTKDIGDVYKICATGFPSMLRQGLSSVSTMVLNNLAASYSDAAVAAIAIVNRISFTAFAVALGIGQGFQPVSAFNYGAKKYSRVKKAFFVTMIMGEVFLIMMAIIGWTFSEDLVYRFQKDPEVIRIGTKALRFFVWALLFQPLTVFANMLFQSIGENRIASFLSGLRSGVILIPVLLLLEWQLGLLGIQIAQPVSDVISFLIALPFTVHFLRNLPADGETPRRNM